MASFYDLKIVTPQGTGHEARVRHIQIPSDRGYVGVLANHAPYVTSVQEGSLEVEQEDGKIETFQVGAGFFSVANNKASLLTDSFTPKE